MHIVPRLHQGRLRFGRIETHLYELPHARTDVGPLMKAVATLGGRMRLSLAFCSAAIPGPPGSLMRNYLSRPPLLRVHLSDGMLGWARLCTSKGATKLRCHQMPPLARRAVESHGMTLWSMRSLSGH
eukprot:scaffold30730_cov31-Tisochrysis_lutea.AAC.2